MLFPWPIHKARLESDPLSGALAVHLMHSDYGAGVTVYPPMSPPCLKNLAPGEMSPGAAFLLDPKSAQALFDGLWEAGLRPAKNEDTKQESGVIVALMKDHIADLRRMAFGEARVNSPDQPATPPTY